MKKILVIQTAFIGDVILTTPVISELQRLCPNCKIDVLVRKGNEGLLLNNPIINMVFILDKKKNKIVELVRLIKHIRDTKYDEIINLHRYLSSGILTFFGGSKETTGFSSNPLSVFYTRKINHSLNANLHEVDRNLKCIEHYGMYNFIRPSLFPTSLDFEKVKVFTSEVYYCLAPSSVWFTKMLPIQKWIELVKILSKKGKVYLLGGANDYTLCESIIMQSNVSNIENFAGKFSFLESAALMKTATRNFVNDSGPLHICSAMNAPVTAFFCSTILGFGFGPLSEDAKVFEVDNLTCRPCGVHGHKECPLGHFKCGVEIELNID
jgi:heptosyltransferase-2